MKKAIELIETREGCEIFEERPRYDVMFRGRKFGELHFNMTGYTSSTGCLPYPGPEPGVPVPSHIGEKSVSAYRREVARLNREWAEIDKRTKGEARKMKEHTPGDWTVAFYATQDGTGGTSVCSVKAGSRTLARTACQVVTDEDEANIRLMAAAPRLLRSCKRIAARVDALRQNHPEWTQYIDMIVHEEDGLSTAIAKAEGREA